MRSRMAIDFNFTFQLCNFFVAHIHIHMENVCGWNSKKALQRDINHQRRLKGVNGERERKI